ncbi:DNA-binding response OmpR family regulator [Cytobacillus oceanisediminis]|jgi:DNA-binding response OmpR family regulator|uniref:DNA-binding response OmpR family regulator n=1 Tax=Cytobacillus oceanisediminis TaxID=665099 RepID=A0A2V2ZWQ1_9BACI|nr:response regulator transcription factor [Cytobacillus oceanisediminis]PWW28387.1 DNA-binding response OmpR family regulator [Cytobacillus oceanisediminis]
MKKILVAEDELAISKVLSAYLQRDGYKVLTAYNGKEALDLFFEQSPHLVLLDIMMPGMDGWSVLEKIREKSACPVIMLTALGDIDYKLKGLNTGADDYISKPFVGDEVAARVNAVLRRSPNVYLDEHIKQFGSLVINFDSHTIFLNGKEVTLTPRDLSLLLFLAERPNRTFTREQLIEHVWGMDYDGSDRAVDLAIKRIRQALSDWPASEGEIRTLRGMGYQFHVYEK